MTTRRVVYLPEPPTTGAGRRHDKSGIDLTWNGGARKITIGGWYDSIVGIEPTTLSLRKFFDLLGITEKDCAEAWRVNKEST